MKHKVKTALLILIILASALLWAVKPVQAHRLESATQPAKIEIALSLDEALDLSLAYGDGRRVDFSKVGF